MTPNKGHLSEFPYLPFLENNINKGFCALNYSGYSEKRALIAIFVPNFQNLPIRQFVSFRSFGTNLAKNYLIFLAEII